MQTFCTRAKGSVQGIARHMKEEVGHVMIQNMYTIGRRSMGQCLKYYRWKVRDATQQNATTTMGIALCLDILQRYKREGEKRGKKRYIVLFAYSVVT